MEDMIKVATALGFFLGLIGLTGLVGGTFMIIAVAAAAGVVVALAFGGFGHE